MLAEGVAFCTKCGAKVAKATAQPINPIASGLTQSLNTQSRPSGKFIIGGLVLTVILIAVLFNAFSNGDVDQVLFGSSVATNILPPTAQPIISGRIVVGKTSSFVCGLAGGELEVTLYYAEFVSGIARFTDEDYALWGEEGMAVWAEVWGGEYILPDEGSIFLRTTWAVKNIGTRSGSFFSSSGRVIYDDRFEFTSVFMAFSDFVNIDPLSPARTGVEYFAVANVIAESCGPLIINFSHEDMRFVIRD